MADVVEVNDLEQLQHYRMAWRALFAKTPRASFFHTFDWLELFWKHFADQNRFRVMIIRSAGTVIGIVPICIQSERYQVGRLRVATYPLANWGTWYSPIGPNQAASMFMAMRHLADTRRDWDLLDLRWSDAEPTDRAGIARAMRAVGFKPRRLPFQQTSVLHLAGTWEEYLQTRNSKWRSEVRRRLRLAQRTGVDVQFQRFRPTASADGGGEPRWDLFDACLKIAGESWQAKTPHGNTLSDEQVRSFLRDCHASAARRGMLDVALLTVSGQPAAFGYNYCHAGSVFGLRTGYSPQFAELGVGGTLMAEMLKDSFARGDRTFDLGIGDYRFKREYRNAVEQNFQFSYYPATAWRAHGVRLTRWIKRRAM